MAQKEKPAKKNRQVHGQQKTRYWECGLKNSQQVFLNPIKDDAPEEFIFHHHAHGNLQQEKGGVIVMMGMPDLLGQPKKSENKDLVAEHDIKHTINWKNLDAGKQIEDAKKKKDMITNGTDFTPPFSPEFVTLTQFGTDITNADKALLSRSKNEPNSAKNLKVALKVIYKDCKNLGTMIQLKMDLCVPDEAIRMCLAAGYTYKAIIVRGPRKNRVRQMTEAGWVQAEGEGEGGRMWQWSFNPYAETPVITDAPYTTGGVTQVNTGKSKTEVFFRWQMVYTKGKYGEWCSWYLGMTP